MIISRLVLPTPPSSPEARESDDEIQKVSVRASQVAVATSVFEVHTAMPQPRRRNKSSTRKLGAHRRERISPRVRS